MVWWVSKIPVFYSHGQLCFEFNLTACDLFMFYLSFTYKHLYSVTMLTNTHDSNQAMGGNALLARQESCCTFAINNKQIYNADTQQC